jgi:general stress protein 26
MTGEDLRARALDVLERCPFPMLATVEGDVPRVRPVSPVWVVGFTVWVASHRSTGKTAQVRANGRVELCFMTDDHQQVRIAGRAVEHSDHTARRNVWDRYPLLGRYFKGIDDPDFILYEVRPERVRYMKEWALTYEEVPL